jgi:hypothetical protein
MRLAESYGKLPLAFEANTGQIDSRVKFLSRGRGHTLFLTATEAVMVLPAGKPADQPWRLDGVELALAALTAVALLDAAGCGVTPRPDRATASPAAASDSPAPTPSPAADVVVTPEDFDQTVTARVGQTIQVRRPTDLAEWELQFDPAVLEPLTSPQRMRSLGPDGWFFRAKASGRTEFVATAAASCPEGSTCPPAAARFHVSLDIQP